MHDVGTTDSKPSLGGKQWFGGGKNLMAARGVNILFAQRK